VVLQALNYLEWESKHKGGPWTGLLLHHRLSGEKFERGMKSYYDAPLKPDGDFFRPINAVEEFTRLYQVSRLVVDEARQAKGIPLNRGDVRSLSGAS